MRGMRISAMASPFSGRRWGRAGGRRMTRTPSGRNDVSIAVAIWSADTLGFGVGGRLAGGGALVSVSSVVRRSRNERTRHRATRGAPPGVQQCLLGRSRAPVRFELRPAKSDAEAGLSAPLLQRGAPELVHDEEQDHACRFAMRVRPMLPMMRLQFTFIDDTDLGLRSEFREFSVRAGDAGFGAPNRVAPVSCRHFQPGQKQ